MNQGERTYRLHPLHTPEWLNELVINSGCYPDINRRTGRTTADALKTLARAIEAPHQEVRFADHHGTEQATRHMADAIRAIADKLGLQHIHLNYVKCTVTFTRANAEGGTHGEYVRCARM